MIGRREGLVPRTDKKRNGEDNWEEWKPGLGPETGTGTPSTASHRLCTPNSNNGGPIADSTSQHICMHIITLLTYSTLINQGCQSLSGVPCPLSSFYFFLHRSEIWRRLPTFSFCLPRTHSFESYALCLVIVISRPRANLCAWPVPQTPDPPSSHRKEGKTSRNPQIHVVRQSCSNISNVEDLTTRQDSGRGKEVKRRFKEGQGRKKGKGNQNDDPIAEQDGYFSLLQRTPTSAPPKLPRNRNRHHQRQRQRRPTPRELRTDPHKKSLICWRPT